jgi:two-component system, chemotaxis family, chemotaxis protein CheY
VPTVDGPFLLPGVAVLVVDDEPDVRDLSRAILERAGCDVVTAEDGVDALEKLADGFEPRVILLDLEMPRLDGEGVLRALANPPLNAARVIVFTAHPFRRPASAAMCIQKPCSASGLIGAVTRVLAA